MPFFSAVLGLIILFIFGFFLYGIYVTIRHQVEKIIDKTDK